jgi:hypothetical protein
MKRKRRLSQQDLRDLGAMPGLMANRIGPDGSARLFAARNGNWTKKGADELMEPTDEPTLTRRSDPGPESALLEPPDAASRTAFHREQWLAFYRRLAAEHQRKADALMRDEASD